MVTCGAIVLLKVMPHPAARARGTDGASSGDWNASVRLAALWWPWLRWISNARCRIPQLLYLGLVFIAISLQVPVLALLLLFCPCCLEGTAFDECGWRDRFHELPGHH